MKIRQKRCLCDGQQLPKAHFLWGQLVASFLYKEYYFRPPLPCLLQHNVGLIFDGSGL